MDESVERREQRGRSRDGYVIDQARLTDLPYGLRMSSRNGCGWIAAYNFLHAHGAVIDEETVAAQMARGALLRGLLGTGPLRVKRYLKRMGFATRLCIVRRGGRCDMERAESGVALYRHGGGWHYVAFAGAPEAEAGARRFLNAVPGDEAHFETMDSFLKRRACFPLALLLLYECGVCGGR